MNRQKRNKIKGAFASIFEKEIFDDAKQRKIEIEYEPVSLDYQKRASRGAKCASCGGTGIIVPGSYTPDFRINGRFYVEAKGFFKPEKRSLMEDFIRSRPDIQLKFLFAQDNWMTKKKKNKYSDWAKKMGVVYAVGKSIPAEWLNEATGGNDTPCQAVSGSAQGARKGRSRNKQKPGSSEPEPRPGVD